MGAGSNWNARVDGCFRRMSHSLKLFVIDDMVLEAGRNASRVEKLPTHSDATSEAIRALLRRGDEEPYRE